MNELRNNPKERLTRWKIFNKLLHSENGTTYEEYANKLIANEIAACDELLRQDKLAINKLLSENGYAPIQQKKQKRMRMYISDATIDICTLKKGRRPSSYYRDLVDFMSHSTGLLTKSWLEDMNVRPTKENEDWSGQGGIVSFEQSFVPSDYLYLPYFFKAIRSKKVLSVTYKPFHRSAYTIIFHPEFLKQYKSLWYAFGLGRRKDSEDSMSLLKIPLDRVIAKPQVCKDFKYEQSGTHYDSFFKEIVGVENYKDRKIERVRIKVKRKLAERIEMDPLHAEQHHDKSLNDDYYVGYSFDVKINKELIRLICSYASDMIVVSPARLVKMVKKEFNKALQSYLSPSNQ